MTQINMSAFIYNAYHKLIGDLESLNGIKDYALLLHIHINTINAFLHYYSELGHHIYLHISHLDILFSRQIAIVLPI